MIANTFTIILTEDLAPMAEPIGLASRKEKAAKTHTPTMIVNTFTIILPEDLTPIAEPMRVAAC